jgi:hypothetical protein
VLRRGERSEGRAAVQDLDEHMLTERLIGIYRSVLSRSKSPADRPDFVAAY